MRRAWFFALLTVACGDGDFEPAGGGWRGGPVTCATTDAGAGAATTLTCPADIDLGCVSSSGRRAYYTTPTAQCSAGAVNVRCSTASGSVFSAGDTRVRCAVEQDGGAPAACDFLVAAGTSGVARLRCAARVEAQCTGALSAVRVTSPTVDTACGDDQGTVTNDAPAAGFPVGDTDVRFRATTGATCLTRVAVVDREAPTLDCASAPTLWRAARDAALPVPAAPAMDRCAATVTVTANPRETLEHGHVPVMYTAVDASGNRATCDGAVEVRNVFAATGLRVAHAAITDGHTAVTLVWDHTADSDVDTYRVERATTPTGPWTSVATVPPDAARYDEPMLPGERAYYRVVSLLGDHEGAATEPVRALSIAASDYDLGVQPVPELVLPANAAAGTTTTRSAPLHAVVRRPVDLAGGPWPLVLLLHGNHGNCRLPSYDASGRDVDRDDACVITNDGACRAGARTPNADGLAYLAETLASHGYVVASVDANAINCRDAGADGFISHRARLLAEHLRRWRGWSTAGGAPFGQTFAGHVDMARVGLFGHSRGAEAVAATPEVLTDSSDVDGITVRSVFSLAPTNFDNPQPGSVAFATLVPTCDGDVFTYNGVQLYDRTLRHEGDEAPAAQLFVGHANHDYFNTEWRFSDTSFGVPSCPADDIEDAPVHQRTLEATVSAWFDGTIPDGAVLEPWLRASGDVPPGLNLHAGGVRQLDIRRSYSAPRVARVDDFADADREHDLLGGGYTFTGSFDGDAPRWCTGVSSPACDRSYSVRSPEGPIRFGWPHHNPFGPSPVRAALAVDWLNGDAMIAMALGTDDAPLFDASGYRVLSLRVSSRASRFNPDDRGAQDFEVRLVDADGHRGAARVSEVTTVPHLYTSTYPRAVLQTVRLTLAGLAARGVPPVDLHRLRSLEVGLSVEELPTGSILLDDIEFAE